MPVARAARPARSTASGAAGWLVLALLVASCKGGAKSSAEGSAAAVASGSGATARDAAPLAIADGPAAPAGAATPVADAALDDPRAQATRCAQACLYLLDVPLADARQAFTRDCKAAWPYADDDCDALLHARNCIYAGFGNVFKRPEWKQRFETQPWYRAKPGFKERDFSAVALANVRALVAASKTCAKPVVAVTADDIALATRAFDELRQGKPFPAVAMQADDRDEFTRQFEIYGIVDGSKFEYVEPRTPDDGHRAIGIGGLEYMAGPGKFDPDVGVTLVFDDQNRLIEAY